jgi:phosphate transport system substrate-binding protein
MKSYFFVFVLLSIFGCRTKETSEENDERGSPVSGMFKIYTDESFYPLVKVLADGFMSVYPQTNITFDTSATGNVFSKFTDKTIHTVITSRIQTPDDSAALRHRNIITQTFHFASDAVALITRDSGTYFDNQVRMKLCTGPGTSQQSAFQVVTDQPASENNYSLVRYDDSLKRCSASWKAAGKQTEILNEVSISESTIGIIGWCYMSDKDDPEVREWRKKVRVIPFKKDTTYIYPTQSSIATGAYPLTRKLYLVTGEPYAGPATGFAAYVASDEGQRIIRLFGLVPSKLAPREIYIQQ